MKKGIKTIVILLIIGSFIGCSPQISQIDYEKLTYEHQQLEKRYALLQQEKGQYLGKGNTAKGGTTVATVPKKTYDKLKESYKSLQSQQEALEAAYNALRNQSQKQAIEKGEKGVSIIVHNNLKANHESLKSQYEALEEKYNKLTVSTKKEKEKASKKAKKKAKKIKKVETIESKIAEKKAKKSKKAKKKAAKIEQIEPKIAKKETPKIHEREPIKGKNPFNEIEEESSTTTITTPQKIAVVKEVEITEQITEVAVDDLMFTFKGSQRLEEKVKIELIIANQGRSKKLKWNVKNIQFIGNDGLNYTANDYRVGRSYASQVDGKLSKKIKADYTVQSAFIFEAVPEAVENVKRLQIMVTIGGKDKILEFNNVEIVPTTHQDFYSDEEE